jgi:hypothetical protein
MTKKTDELATTTPGKDDKNWLRALVERLPVRKLTAAQTGNYVMDLIGLAYFGKYLVTKPPSEYVFALLIVMLGIGAWCHVVSMPSRKSR